MDAIEKAEYFRVLVDLTRCLKDSEWVMPFSVFPMEMAIFICWELVECPSGIVGIELSIMNMTKLSEIIDDGDPFIRLVTICPSIAITSDNVLDVLSAFHTDIEEIWNSSFMSEPRNDAVFFRPRPHKFPSNSEEAIEAMVIPLPLEVAASAGFERGQEL